MHLLTIALALSIRHIFSLFPSQILNLASSWKLQLPVNSTGGLSWKCEEISPSALGNNYFLPGYFFANNDSSAVEFVAPTRGLTTPGSSNPRCELREMSENGTNAAYWSTYDGSTRTLSAQYTVLKVPAKYQTCTIAQIFSHIGKPFVEVQYRAGAVIAEVYNHTDASSKRFTIAPKVHLGSNFSIQATVIYKSVFFYFDGQLLLSLIDQVPADTLYFKAGAYGQYAPLEAANDSSHIWIHSLSTSYKGPGTTAVPTTDPTHAPILSPTGLTVAPTTGPAIAPSASPTTRHPPIDLARAPSSQPSQQPTSQPTSAPVALIWQPSNSPTTQPSCQPSRLPIVDKQLNTHQPTTSPTAGTINNLAAPTLPPSTLHPSSNIPSYRPLNPTNAPSTKPSVTVTVLPSTTTTTTGIQLTNNASVPVPSETPIYGLGFNRPTIVRIVSALLSIFVLVAVCLCIARVRRTNRSHRDLLAQRRVNIQDLVQSFSLPSSSTHGLLFGEDESSTGAATNFHHSKGGEGGYARTHGRTTPGNNTNGDAEDDAVELGIGIELRTFTSGAVVNHQQTAPTYTILGHEDDDVRDDYEEDEEGRTKGKEGQKVLHSEDTIVVTNPLLIQRIDDNKSAESPPTLPVSSHK